MHSSERRAPRAWGRTRCFHVSGDAPPTLVLSGSEDKLIPVATVLAFQKAMQAKKVRCDLRIYEHAGHGFFNAGRHGDSYHKLTRDAMDAFLVSLGWLKESSE